MPTIEDPQTKEIREIEAQKEYMLKLIMEENAQIRDMEDEMGKLIKENQQNTQLVIVPLNIISLVTIPTTRTSTSMTTQEQTTDSISK